MKVGAVIVAAGRGVRAGGGIPKQWRALHKGTVAQASIRAFTGHADIRDVVLVLHPDDIDTDLWPREPGLIVASGGASRSASVLAGLRMLNGKTDAVLIHDAARPCVTTRVIDDVISALRTAQAAAPAVAVVDALWTGENGQVTGTADRTGLYRAQTPQGFHLDAIIKAHRQFPEGAADDVEVARRAGLDVVIVPGDEDNLKITLPGDFARAEAILRARDGH
ncbi:2-C-methyl-D-erythritol 4-phosphate cytidylyltransferase [Roseobacter denitrificans]|uniref:2-C-methyl-D-erythritol 4-phosphate cytidylyltransferase n=1 Tax=Roseobacter denitrificans (strain ATCC 33942 / OCh 114) TaxID=375451 RepID=ISPD_ROSDO|nr:2-C-methyl-D-erythritol 4-phosphate cytidylyltransferase [Roseobacter denitrificans]Q165P6.1 RecName: Full=2-C-methyl-D-erythritol 4-phosphate cytidylyltransferase; AltName: Full=4-diphosphocytidyl-2C-methyl-D-erythritol synthase; AltName: Full=MEP cytidylyltransferase; Short=MCT [Roseobacter denitrificans OCh 114]ABG32297.1 2-C-methyl-D-erythritol 4-phosphate cytidylyltransferase, putative [Roseobacter denitrificans OCh 114]AVL51781.1 2-C-methyl-D-erythritol 4-phosphate cytidylyltransferase 